jgi:hypothetical protein
MDNSSSPASLCGAWKFSVVPISASLGIYRIMRSVDRGYTGPSIQSALFPTVMAAHPIADPGYESDTGPRNIPTCAHFEHNQPVPQVILVESVQIAL